MKKTRIVVTVLLGFLACGGAAQATEQILYKSVLPNGTISYSDKPLRGVRARPLMVEPHPADSRAAQEAEAAAALRQKQMLRNFDARAARAVQLDQQIAAAADAAEWARNRVQQASTVQEGDRHGRRLTGEYFRRQEEFHSMQTGAEQRLDALKQQRAALQP